jgi:hypothetical protein
MPVIHDPPDYPFDSKHPFAKTAILFAPKRLISSIQNSSPMDSNPSDLASSEEALTGMDDPSWQEQATERPPSLYCGWPLHSTATVSTRWKL